MPRPSRPRPRSITVRTTRPVRVNVEPLLRTESATSNSYTKANTRPFTRLQTLALIQRIAKEQPPGNIIVVRGQGGTRSYRKQWWSSPPMEAGEIANYFDEDNEDEYAEEGLYGLQDVGPLEIEIYIREEEE